MVMSEGNAAMTDMKKGPVDQVVHKVFTPSTVKMNAVRYPDMLTLDPYCKDSYSYGLHYVIGLVTLNRPRVHCLPYILHLSSYVPRLSIVLPHNHPSSLNRKGFEGLVRPYDKHEKNKT